MKRSGVIGIGVGIGVGIGLLAGESHAAGLPQDAVEASQQQELLNQYCIGCHNERANTAGLALDLMDLGRVGQDAEVWEKVIRKVRTGMMPPAGARRPERVVLDAFATELETELDRAADLNPNPGTPTLARLNRAEYANAIRDLLDLDVDVTTLLPGDESSHGFDNIAGALGVSPALAQGYVSSAMKISRLAVGNRTALPEETRYTAAGMDESGHIDGLPLGTRGGLLVDHTFPLDGEYQFSIGGNNFTLDGNRVEIGNPRSFRLPITAGPHRLGVFTVDQRRPSGVDDLWSVSGGRGRGGASVTINGPFDATGPGALPSRRRIFVCSPEGPDQEQPCAREIVRTLARRAFRRPAQDSEVERLMRFYEEGRRLGDFETGVERAVAGVLVSPAFMFRSEAEPEDLPPGAVFGIDDLALASRLSFFLWSSIPDEELLDIAIRGRLSDPDVLEQQVRRMLRDPKARALTDNFAGQWLQLRKLDEVEPLQPPALANPAEGPVFNENLRQAFRLETELLFETIVHEDRSIIELLDADFTFVDEQLARHYGIPGITGTYFRRIPLDADSPRRGLLGQGSIMTLTSAPNRTSPVVRGQWVLENVLGSPAPDPPPGVETDLDPDPDAPQTTLRERLEAHRANAVCASCHQIMDPIGLALENFDQIGMWRESDGDSPIDASGQLVDGTPLAGVSDLRAALLDRSDSFVATAAEKLLIYALGRPLDYYDMPAVRTIVRQAEQDDFRFSALILGVVESVPFQMRTKSEEESAATDVAIR